MGIGGRRMAERGKGRIVAIVRAVGRTSATDGGGEHVLALMGASNTGADSKPILAVKPFLRVFETDDSGGI